ncbi:MAG TPA: hypothetical protein DIW47_08370 [Bacteroidetes bacterium]|nr:hypothetical protein [Bacteroidota bacterium]
MKKMYLLIVALLFCSNLVLAQNGDAYLAKDDYQGAIRAYRSEVQNNPAAYFNMARAYFAMQDFDAAILALESWKSKDPKCDHTKADKWLELLRRDDQPVKIENMGSTINTSEDQYVPRVSADGKTLYFLSDERSGGMGGEDIWYCERQSDGSWGVPKNFYSMNTTSNEGILAISPDGNVAIVFGNYKGSFGSGDLFYSVKTENGWSFPCNLGGTINTKNWESLAALGPDGKTLIYSTSREGGKGNSDLWVSQLTETGWTTPKNLGAAINTGEDEKWPFIAADGKTMYFSSNGHFGFGGSDLFMVKRLDDSWTNWSEPVNLGPYINSIKDDKDFSVSGSGINGFVTRSGSPDGYGANDIYQFYVPVQFRPEQVFNVFGRVSDENDSNAWVNIRYFDMDDGAEVNKTTTDAADGMYTVALQKGKKYQVVIDMKGYLYFSSILDLSDPNLLRKKEPFYEKLKFKQDEVNRLQTELDRQNAELKAALQSGSENIEEMFEAIEANMKRYRKALDDLENVMAEAKYQWLEEEGQSLNLRQDYKVQTARIGAKFELKNIFFEFGKATLTKESEKELDKLYEIMAKSEIVIELGGHSDSIGSEEANEKLSQDRVNSVKSYLVNKGINTQRIQAVGYGETQPVASNHNEEGRALNRRVEVKILKLQMDREGGEVVTDDDKKKKKEPKEEVVPVEVAEKGNMLDLLQKAAKNGGLPSGSDCNKEVQYGSNPNYKPTPTKKKYNYGGNGGISWNFGDVDKGNFILKSFNVSVINWGYKPLDQKSLGAEVSFVTKKLKEHHFQYYFANPDSVSLGIGYDYLRNWQIKSTPILFCYGFESKLFLGKVLTMTEEKLFGHVAIPFGIRYMMQPKGVVVAPELFYNLSLWTSKRSDDNGAFEEGASYLRLGVNARWKLVHAGVHLNAGQTTSFLGFRAGVSF